MYISKYTMKQEVMLYMRERGVREWSGIRECGLREGVREGGVRESEVREGGVRERLDKRLG